MSIEEYKKDYVSFLQDTRQEHSKQSKQIYINLLQNKYTIYKPTAEQIEQLKKEL